VVEFFMLIREYFAQQAEPSDSEVCASSVARGSDIASSLYAPAEMASYHLASPATHTHHLSGVFHLERGEVKCRRGVQEFAEAEPSDSDEFLRLRLFDIEA